MLAMTRSERGSLTLSTILILQTSSLLGLERLLHFGKVYCGWLVLLRWVIGGILGMAPKLDFGSTTDLGRVLLSFNIGKSSQLLMNMALPLERHGMV
jgi:hypothetical protein